MQDGPTPAPLDASNMPKPSIPTSLEPLRNVYGIEETADVVTFICEVINAVKLSLADDGKITVGDYLKFVQPVSSLPNALTNISQVPFEVMDDITDAEWDRLANIVIANGLATEEDKALIVAKKIAKILEQIKELVLYDFVG